VTARRYSGDVRRVMVLAVACVLINERRATFESLTRAELADASGISGPAIEHHFGDMISVRRALVQHAVEHNEARVLLQALAAGVVDPMVLSVRVRREIKRLIV